MLENLYLVAAGLAGGFLAGLLGIGGGIIYIIILPFALTNVGVPADEIVQYTIANSLFGTFAASLSGCLALFRKNEIYWRDTFIVAIFSVIISLLSLKYIVNTLYYSQKTFNSIIVLILFFILIKTITKAKTEPDFDPVSSRKNPMLAASGASGGLIASLSGLGGGAVIVPVLNLGLKMDIKRAKSISLGMIVVSSFCMTIFNSFEIPVWDFHYYNTGYLVWPVALMLSLGVVVGSPFGVKVGRRLPSYTINYIFAGFILVVTGYKAYQLVELL